MKKFLDSPHPYALITILCWAPAFVLTHLLAPWLTPASLGFLRYGIASVILIIILAVRRMQLPELRDLPLFALAAACGFSVYMLIFNHGVAMVNSATSSVIIAMAPVFTDVMASILFHEQLKKAQWAALLIQFGGVLILLLSGSSFSFNEGALWLLLCALMFGTYNILQRQLTKKYPPFLTSAVCVILGAIELIWAAPAAIRQFSAAPAEMKLCTIFLGVFSSALAYVTWAIAFSKAEKTSEVANYMFVTPFFATLLGFALNNEVPTLSTVIGGAMILTGAIVFNKNKK